MNSFLDVTYSRGMSKAVLPAQYQYNSGQQLRIVGVESGVTVSVHYAVRGMLKPLARPAALKDKAWVSAIPNALMAQKLPIQGYVYMVDATSAQTVFEIEIPIIERPIPDGYDIDDEDVADVERMMYDLQQALVSAESIVNLTASANTLNPGEQATAKVVDNNGVKQLQLGIPQGVTGQPGGYYIPVISEDGMLTWTTSDSAMGGVDFKFNVVGPEGKQGDPGVYYGSEEPTDPNIMVWIDEDGLPDSPTAGGSGATFTPSVSNDGVISWSNDAGLANPNPVNIKGPKGDDGITPQISIGTVETGAAGSNAQASITGNVDDLKLNLTIPRGASSTGGSGTGTMVSINGVEADEDGAVELKLSNIKPDVEYDAEGSVILPVVADSVAWGSVTGKPSSYPPENHSHGEYATSEELNQLKEKNDAQDEALTQLNEANANKLGKTETAADSAKLGGVAASEYAKKTELPSGGADPLTIYPVGSIYMSVDETSPAGLFGGTWDRLPDEACVEFQGGTTVGISAPAKGYIDYKVTFEKPFSSTPLVSVSFVSDSESMDYTSMQLVIKPGSDKTSFEVRIFNGASTARAPGVKWFAATYGAMRHVWKRIPDEEVA